MATHDVSSLGIALRHHHLEADTKRIEIKKV